jgi:rare lipoprotein A (peptidoglycan hydrolase)
MLRRTPAAALNLKSILGLGFAALLSFAVAGCSGQASNQEALPAIQPAPIVAAPKPAAPSKVTTASFYSPEFQGHLTSSGEVYNQNEMTAASRTLPIGSEARVTNLKTGKSVVVRINDRGPFVKGRGIDLSRAAAESIGLNRRGIAKVRVTRLKDSTTEESDLWAGSVTMRDGSPAASAQAPHPTNPPSPEPNPASPNPPVIESSMIPDSVGTWFMELVDPAK